MNTYLFHPAKYERLYNCSMFTSTEWESKKNPIAVIGSLNIATVTIYQCLYFVFLLTMLRKPFWQHSCYKIMFVLGVCDVGATLIGGTFAGIFAIRGDIFCTNQTVMYLVGCVEQPIWGACCLTGLILLLNRAVNLMDEKYAHALFGKSKVYIWLMIPFGVFFHCYFFTTPYFFNSIYGAAFLNPYMGVPEIQGDFSEYNNPFSEWFGYFVSVMYPFMYLVLCVILWHKSRSSQSGVNSTQIQITIQSIAVSILLAVVASSYVTIQFIEIPKFMIVALQFMWMASHGASVFTYIFINKSMRKEAGRMIKGWLSIAKSENLESAQKTTTSLYRSLVNALVIDLAICVIMVILPIGLCGISLYFQLEWASNATLLAMSFANWYPCVSHIVWMWFTAPYRRALIRMFKGRGRTAQDKNSNILQLSAFSKQTKL